MTGNVGKHGGEAAGRSLGDQAPYHPYPFKLGQLLPYGDNPAIHMMFQHIFKEILYFQRRDFSYEFEWNQKLF